MIVELLSLGLLFAPIPNELPPTFYAEQRIEEEGVNEYMGTYELTAYTWTGNKCTDGIWPCAGVTVASNDPNLWHKSIYIEGYGVFFVHDTGGMASNVIDIYMDSYDECIQFGRQKGEVYIVEQGL